MSPTAWRKLYGHSPTCGAGVDRRTLTSPSVVHCHFFELFGARRFTASNSHHCGTIPLRTSSYYYKSLNADEDKAQEKFAKCIKKYGDKCLKN
ncbi:UNVERIFIED_CONTAM: hypothetical protein NCL1_49189 [Trichonephila clavipes]